MGVEKAVNIDDLYRMAKRRTPKVAFDFIEGGVEAETALPRNESAFNRYNLLPRYLTDVTKIDQTTTLFGRSWAHPFGFAPTGAAGLFRMGSDLNLAAAAAKANIPYVMSGASNDTIEDVARIAPDQTWYQVYAARDIKITEDMIRRCADAGLGALVLTVDVPIRPRRERNARNQYSHDLRKITPGRIIDGILHPRWTYEYLRNGGAPTMGNWVPYAPSGSNVHQVLDFMATQTPASGQTWHELETYRRLWKGPLIVKGILHPDDATRAADLGANGVIVSNHGGRQLDRAPASLDAFPAIKAAVGDRMTVMLDSGVRRGADIIIGLCLGADFVFVGRAAVYGVVAGAEAGATRTIDILSQQLATNLAQMGVASIDQLGPHCLTEATRA
ncbi:MAG: alpha-hydroxy-acid oxidizing protein [Alphaproteobacteria bacterium]|nr:alpha-hydroxy-acid oxidizing protein [Alphaproteobacteria bacterium]